MAGMVVTLKSLLLPSSIAFTKKIYTNNTQTSGLLGVGQKQ